MNSCVNHCSFIGRLVRDPEIKMAKETKIAKFNLAVDNGKKNGTEETLFLNCAVFGKMEDTIEKYLKRGQKIAVSGGLKQDDYTDKNGIKRTSVYLVVYDFAFCDSKQADNENKTESPDEPLFS